MRLSSRPASLETPRLRRPASLETRTHAKHITRHHTPLTCPEDVALIESLEESKRVATDITDKVAEARETEVAINDSRNKCARARVRAS